MKMSTKKHIFNPEKVECPFCGCKPEEGFLSERQDEFSDDQFIRDVYVCPKCKETSVRCYEFYAWEDDNGDEIEED